MEVGWGREGEVGSRGRGGRKGWGGRALEQTEVQVGGGGGQGLPRSSVTWKIPVKSNQWVEAGGWAPGADYGEGGDHRGRGFPPSPEFHL